MDEFGATKDEKPYVHFFFGVMDINKEGTSMWDPVNYGEAILDPEFNMARIENQKYLLDFCDDMANLDFSVPNSAKCWYKDFHNWLINVKKASFPVASEDDFIAYLTEWSQNTLAG